MTGTKSQAIVKVGENEWLMSGSGHIIKGSGGLSCTCKYFKRNGWCRHIVIWRKKMEGWKPPRNKRGAISATSGSLSDRRTSNA